MALMTRTLPALNNGISRQPAILRSFDQTDDEINTWGQIATGVGRRPPTELVQKLTGISLGNAYVHHINRDISERYIVLIDNGSIKVFDQADGSEKTVTAPGGLGYLDTSGDNYRAVTVADYTFIVNTTKTCALKAVGADATAQPNYYIWPGGTNVTFGVPGSAYQYPANHAAGTLVGSVQKFEDLPASPTVGDVYKVVGSSTTSFVSYYVRWSADGVWDETFAPGLANAIDATTMPHALVRQGDGTFVFAPFSWRPRRVGDATTNPNPTFIGRTMRDVFFFKNRLGFLVDESVVFSAAGDYGDFWRRTVLDYINSDTLSVSATTTDVAVLDYAVPFNDGIMLFSAQRQFSLSNGEAGLSASSVEINPVTGYLMSPGVRPVAIGSQVYFGSDSSGKAALQEYTRLDGSDATDAAEVTAHVPGLLPKGVSQLIAAPDMNAVVVLAAKSGDKTKAYAYQFFWDKDSKIQSAWRQWDFGDAEIISGTFVDGKVHLLVKRGSELYLEKMNLAPEAVSGSLSHLIYLDRQTTVTGSYNSGTNKTTFNLPYAPDQSKFRMIRTDTGNVPESLIEPSTYEWVDADTVRVPGDETGAALLVGENFTTYLRFSRQYPNDYQGRPVSTGRLQLHAFTVVYTDTAFFRAEVSPYGPDAVLIDNSNTFTKDFTGRLVGSASFLLGTQVYRDGAFTFEVAGDAALARVALSNDSPYASTWVSAEWEGLFFSRSL